MKKSILWLGAAALALSACAESEAGTAAGADESTAVAAETGVGGPDDEHGDMDHGEDGSNILLTDSGIMLAGTEESMIAFGDNSLDSIERAIAVFGDTYDYQESTDCGAGAMEFANWGPVVLMTMNGEFVGWELREAQAEPWMGTPGGVTIGSPRADLEAALGEDVVIEESTLGIEFFGGGMSGLLSSDAPDATVTALWAGTNCVMR